MEKLSSEQKEYYLKEADGHANFLAEQVFKPAFVMAFVHGVRHGREDVIKELKARQGLCCKKEKMKAELNDELNNSSQIRNSPQRKSQE